MVYQFLEARIVELLGYGLVRKDENTWIVLDKIGQEVGIIEYDVAFEVYNTKIDSSEVFIDVKRPARTISMNFPIEIKGKAIINIRYINQKNAPLLMYPICIDIGTNTGEKLSIHCYDITIDNTPGLDRYGLFVSCTYPSVDKDISEEVVFANLDYDQNHIHKMYQYTYAIYDDQKSHIDTVRAISYYDNPDELIVNKKEIKSQGLDKKIVSSHSKIINETVREFSKKDSFGIELFHHFRTKFNEISPFKEDVFSELFNETLIAIYGLEEFFKCDEKQK